jgi:hypothetical protein
LVTSPKREERFSLSQSEIMFNEDSYRNSHGPQPNMLKDLNEALREPNLDLCDEDTALLINEDIENPYK